MIEKRSRILTKTGFIIPKDYLKNTAKARDEILMMYRYPQLLTATLTALLITSTLATGSAQSLQDIVNQGNTAANVEQYPEAISLYEKAVSMDTQNVSGHDVLSKNLNVLYFNYAVKLQNEKRYDQSDIYFEKALLKRPDDSQLLKAYSANFYYRAMDLKASGNPPDYAAIRQNLEKAIALNPTETAFPEALASMYLLEGREYALKHEYEKAAAIMEAGLEKTPDYAPLKTSLANVYLSTAMKHRNDEALRKEWAEKALPLAEGDETLTAQAEKIAAGDFANAQVGGVQTSRSTSDLSIQEKLAMVEQAVGIEPDESKTLIDRMEEAEEQVYGDEQKGALNERMDKIFSALFGSGQTISSSLPNLIQQRFTNGADTYLDQIFEYTGGRVVRWASFPVRVSIEQPEDVQLAELFHDDYIETVKKGLDSWVEATDHFISYTIVPSDERADIQISFSENSYENPYANPEKIEGSNDLKDFEPPKNSKLATAMNIASALTPGYYGLAPRAVAAGLQYREAKKYQTIIDESKLELGLKDVSSLPHEQALILLQNMAAESFGHALGLKGSSNNESDLLYPGISAEKLELPSSRDLSTLREIYSRPANIVLNVR